MTAKQLVVINKGIMIPILSETDEVKFIKVPEFPFSRWPDLTPCLPVNSYLLYLLADRGGRLSLLNNGGTVTTYAYELSHIIRYCYKNKLSMASLSDRRFVAFCNYLKAEVCAATGVAKRSDNHVARILRRTLDLLEYLNKYLAGGRDLDVKAEKRERRAKDGKKSLVWYHACIPVEQGGEARLPIGDAVIKKLKNGIRRLWPESAGVEAYWLQRRKLLLISVLEKLGCRRSEAARIRVVDIYDAYNSPFKRPLLKIPNVKGRRRFRYVPVTRVALEIWIDYIETARLAILHKNNVKDDHGFLFVSVNSGFPISIDYITTEINELRHRLNISDPCHPHLFRHHFITEVIKILALQYSAVDSDSFTQMLINDARLLKDLREWVGHKSIQSLMVYIDLAFRELARVPDAYEEVRLTMVIDDCAGALDDLQARFDEGTLSETEFIYLARQVLASTQSEIRRGSNLLN
ncbi:tyrosine-type recombinase/integrase [Pseudomonas aeruginosa]